MAVHSPRRKLTYQDFLLIPDDGMRHEIIDGVHYVTPSPFYPHQRVLGELFLLIGNFVKRHDLGVVLFAPMDVLLSEHDVVEPDLLFISKARRAIVTERYMNGPPDLVVEVLSASTRKRDLNLKRERYELLGVFEYWVVDPKRQTVAIYRRPEEPGEPGEPEENTEGFLAPVQLSALADGRLTTPLLAGLEIPLREIFVL